MQIRHLRERQRDFLKCFPVMAELLQNNAIFKRVYGHVFLPMTGGVVDQGHDGGVEFMLDGKHGGRLAEPRGKRKRGPLPIGSMPG